MEALIAKLLESAEPSIRYKVQTRVLGVSDASPTAQELREEIRQSERVRALLSSRDAEGRIEPVHHVYLKWTGAHWVFASLAELGYPSADASLHPIRDQVLDFWLQPQFLQETVCEEAPPSGRRRGVPVINGRARRCASQQSNALYAALTLGFGDDKRCDQLAELLMRWQWPDGGWNCDCKPDAHNSSFWESRQQLRLGQLGAGQRQEDERVGKRRRAGRPHRGQKHPPRMNTNGHE